MKLHTEHFVTIALVIACGCSGSSADSTEATGTSGATSGASSSGSGTAASSASGTGGASSNASSSSGETSSGTGGAPGDGGVSGCVGLQFCEDFESYPTGKVATAAMLGPWKAAVANATMAVDETKPHGGKKALHITAMAGAAAHGTLSQTAAKGLIPGNNLFGRTMLFYSDTGGNGLPLGVHSWIFNASGTSTEAKGNVTMNLGGGGAKLQLNYHPPAPLTEQSVQGGTMTAGAWHCVQWQYDGSGTPTKNDAKVWVDGMLAVEAPASKGWNFATPWSTADFGFTHFQTLMNGVDVYLDDFALDEKMIPCP